MKAYVKIIYSSEGASPVEVEERMRKVGFIKIKGSVIFQTDVASAEELDVKSNEVHDALRGAEVRYMPSIERLEGMGEVGAPTYQDRLEKLRSLGVDVDELNELLENDTERFKGRAMEMLQAQIERIAKDREKEINELEARRRLENARDNIVSLAGSNGMTVQELIAEVGIDEEFLYGILEELVKAGRITAEQRGRRVVYVAI
jgi:predicted transcriptional regulator